MGGHATAHPDLGDVPVVRAHADVGPAVGPAPVRDRVAREELEDAVLTAGATRARGAGNRVVPEPADPERTCFERDRDRILHSSAFRRLAGKTQVFVLPEDHQRTRLTHALEVTQVAAAISRAVGLNVALTEAIAIGHDCGHGPGGHASEDAFSPYVDGGYDHAVWGADVVLEPLNLCLETLDGIRNHSWSRPVPTTPEGEVVSWADRIAYVCHDFEDAVHVGIVRPEQLPAVVRERCGDRRSRQLHAFIDAVVATVRTTGTVGMPADLAEALAEFRRFNYEHIYMRPASLEQNTSVVRLLRALVDFHADHPFVAAGAGDAPHTVEAGSPEAQVRAVTYVGGMTDRFAFDQARTHLGWRDADLPRGIG
ncbi:MAG: HD domain-containing protein [Actinomycetes bacterium]